MEDDKETAGPEQILHRLVVRIYEKAKYPPADPFDALHNVVRHLRTALGEAGAYIDGTPGAGYCLIAGGIKAKED